MDEKAKLLKRVQVCDFVLDETALFLDTHPTCKEALDYYKKYQQLLQTAQQEYVSKFGPLQQTDYDGGPEWTWATTPWPWEKEV